VFYERSGATQRSAKSGKDGSGGDAVRLKFLGARKQRHRRPEPLARVVVIRPSRFHERAPGGTEAFRKLDQRELEVEAA